VSCSRIGAWWHPPVSTDGHLMAGLIVSGLAPFHIHTRRSAEYHAEQITLSENACQFLSESKTGRLWILFSRRSLAASKIMFRV
jgi:hypothetical protein